jgi:perosamine synthetase
MVIPYTRHTIDEADIAAVTDVLCGKWLTQGGVVAEFEAALAGYVEAEHAVAFSSGTAALHAAAFATGLAVGRRAVTSSLTFAASANCARYVGADVEFIDVDPHTLNMDLTLLPSAVDALIVVHYAGYPVPLARLKGRPPILIEDAAHALGATTPDGPVGNCAKSDVSVFSFHPTKVITTAEGGAATTNSSELAERMRVFRNHGIIRDDTAPSWKYSLDTVGYNYRLSDLHAALGLSQLRKIDEWLTQRSELAHYYSTMLQEVSVDSPAWPDEDWRHAWHLYPVRVDNRNQVFDHMRASGINVQVHYVPLHTQPTFHRPGQRPLPVCESAGERIMSLPLFPGLTRQEQDFVISTLQAAIEASSPGAKENR